MFPWLALASLGRRPPPGGSLAGDLAAESWEMLATLQPSREAGSRQSQN